MEDLMWTLKLEGFTRESACRLLTDRWTLGSNVELTVNSPAHTNPKKPTNGNQGMGERDSCLIGIYQRASGTAHHSKRFNMEPVSQCLGPLERVEYEWRRAATARWMEGLVTWSGPVS